MNRELEVPITLRPEGKTVFALPGARLIEALASAGIVVQQPCGGRGTCGKCRVRVVAGECPPTPGQLARLTEAELAAGWRLACQAVIHDPLEIEVPDDARLVARHQIHTAFATELALSEDPPIEKTWVELPPPTRQDDAADLRRLQRAVGPLEIDLDLLRELPGRLRDGGFRGTAVVARGAPGEGAAARAGRLIDFESGDPRVENLAVAVDLGTTTLVATLLDVPSGRQRAMAARLNPQTRFGDDVLSRIVHATTGSAALEQLRRAAVEAVDAMVGELCETAHAPREQIYQVCVSGNTTMQQLFCGIDPQWLGRVPFIPATGPGVEAPATALGLAIHPRGRVFLMPVIGGFVGGDTTAGVLATGLGEVERPTLLIDVGTNGEIVLAADGQLLAASTAAGPAFEGARISCGMRGSDGAIEKVVVDGRLRCGVIGGGVPRGICGSGLIDLVAVLLDHGLLTPQGRLQPADQLPGDLPDDLARRVVIDDGQPAFVVASADESADGRPIRLTQRDLREVQLATGAIRAGVAILLRHAGLRPEQLDAVLLAGGFGNFIRRSRAQRIGLLPPEVEHHRIRYVGNTSLAGACLAARSCAARRAADELAARTRHVDLSTDPAFPTTFADSMIFPT